MQLRVRVRVRSLVCIQMYFYVFLDASVYLKTFRFVCVYVCIRGWGGGVCGCMFQSKIGSGSISFAVIDVPLCV